MGDPYLPFREVLGLLTGDMAAQWAAGAMSREQARRLWQLLPWTVEAMVRSGPDLIGLLVPGDLLLERAYAVRPWPLDPTLLAQLEALVARRATTPSLRALEQSALFEQYTQVLGALAAHRPLLLAVDDLQWADSGSLHLLFHLGRYLPGGRILLVGAYRPAEVVVGRPALLLTRSAESADDALLRERHPLEPIVHEFTRSFGDVQIDLDRVESRRFVDALLDSEPNCLGDSFRAALHRHTQGHPLFTIELLRGIQERGELVLDADGCWIEGPALDWETLPARVEAVAAERIGRLPPRLRDLLTVASVEGETFTAEVVARVQNASERQTVRSLSETLDRQHRLVSAHGIQRLGNQRLSHYRFRHILFQKYLYGSLDPAERAYLHEQVGTVLEELYPTPEIADIAVQLAWHFEEAGIVEKAIHYLQLAGARAVQLSAYQEGATHLARGLALVMTLPDSPERDRRALALQLTRGMAFQGIYGTYSLAMKEAYLEARELCQKTGDLSRLCQVLGELATHHYVRAEHQQAREFAEQAVRVARDAGDPLLVALSHWYLGFVFLSLGEYAMARDHLEEEIALYNPQEHHSFFVLFRGSDPGSSALAYSACTLWCLGYPEQAMARSQEALGLARALGHPFTLADVLCYAGCMHSDLRQDAPALADYAQEMMQLSREKVPVWLPWANRYWGGALTMMGRFQEGIALLREVISTSLPRGERCYLSEAFCSIARAEAAAGNSEEGLTTIVQALAFVDETNERFLEAELYRLQGELLLMQGRQADAEASLRQAIEVARRQQAKSWELRAATSLARLWQMHGKRDEARQALAQIYGWFTEGFDTPDLQEARALLDELA